MLFFIIYNVSKQAAEMAQQRKGLTLSLITSDSPYNGENWFLQVVLWPLQVYTHVHTHAPPPIYTHAHMCTHTHTHAYKYIQRDKEKFCVKLSDKAQT